MITSRQYPKLDPYLIWGLDSDFKGSKPPRRNDSQQRLLPIAVELSKGQDFSHVGSLMTAPKAYKDGTRFLTGTVSETNLHELLPLVKRLKLGLPSTPGALALAEMGGLGGGVTPLIGFIDNGIGFLNRHFKDPQGNLRIFSLWDQEDCVTPCSPWATLDFGYGRELRGAAVKDWLKKQGTAANSEEDLYALLGYEPCRKRLAHGTHVMDLAAGNKSALGRFGDLNDEASKAPIIAVQLPWKPFKDTSSSSLCVHLLDGLRYILGLAGKIRPVIINVSDGAYAGSHDGNSLLECAIDDLLVEYPKLTLVIAAGNGYEQKLHGAWSGLETAPQLKWRVLPDTKTDSFLEIWCPRKNNVSITLTSPEGRTVTVKLGESQALVGLDKKTQIGGVYSSTDTDLNGSDRAMFLVAVAPTRPKIPSNPTAPHGVWIIGVNGSTTFDAYIQRNNPALGDRGPRRQSYFIDDRKKPYVTGKGTLNNLATGERPIVVGGYYLRGQSFDPKSGKSSRVASYSSAGPGRKGSVQGVNVLAPSDDSPVLHGLLASGVRSGTSVRMDGTSVAAPIVTRFIANSYDQSVVGVSANLPLLSSLYDQRK